MVFREDVSMIRQVLVHLDIALSWILISEVGLTENR